MSDRGKNVFLSWSGERSHEVAKILHEALPDLIQAANPWISTEDIEKGTSWDSEIKKAVQTCDAVIICLTPENWASAWMGFEAGAFLRSTKGAEEGKSYVCPLLCLGLEKSTVKGPWITLQMTECEKEDFSKMLLAIRNAIGDSVEPAVIKKALYREWESIKGKLDKIEPAPASPTGRGMPDMVKEILDLVRGLARDSDRVRAKTILISEDLANALYQPQRLAADKIVITSARNRDEVAEVLEHLTTKPEDRLGEPYSGQ